MLKGTMLGDYVLLGTDGTGLPVTETDAPKAPEGYTAQYKWVSDGAAINQVWELVPKAGTATEAAVTLAQMQAAALSDADAVKVPALFSEWYVGTDSYAAGTRVTYQGKLYKCLQTHKPQADWTPVAATSLWAEVLPGQSGNETKPDGTPGEWKQPDSTNGYAKGDKVTHNGKTWVSNVDNNVWEPGATGVTQWDEVK